MIQDNDQIAIRAQIAAWTNAICKGDMAHVISGRTDDIVMFDVPEPIQEKGIDAYRQTWELFFAHNATGPDLFRISELRVEAGDRVAFAHGLLTINGGDAECRLTLGLEKIEGAWRVSHEHHSMPIQLG